MLPPELMEWADLPTIALVIIASELLKPLVKDYGWVKAKPQRIILLPLVLGALFGLLIELSLPEFDSGMALRRILVDSFGAAGLFKAGKTFLQGEKKDEVKG